MHLCVDRIMKYLKGKSSIRNPHMKRNYAYNLSKLGVPHPWTGISMWHINGMKMPQNRLKKKNAFSERQILFDQKFLSEAIVYAI